MFTPLTHGDHMAFFEIAATLIPILLFGGVVAERLRPKSDDPLVRIFSHAAFIPALGSLAILAEVTAILAIVSGTSNWLSRLLVAVVLTGGLLAIIVSLWLPWMDQLHKKDAKWARTVVRISVVGLTGAFVGSVALMTSGVSTGAEIERLDAYLEAQGRSNATQIAAQNRGASLLAASGRAQQQRITAEARHEDPAVIASLRSQERRLLQLAISNSEWQDLLVLDGANLYRMMLGAPTLKQLPRKEAPRDRKPSRIRTDSREKEEG